MKSPMIRLKTQSGSSQNRVLAPGGVVLAGEPVVAGKPTVERPAPSYGGLRRDYGSLDLGDRFSPFSVEVVDLTLGLSAGERERRGLLPGDDVIVLRKGA